LARRPGSGGSVERSSAAGGMGSHAAGRPNF
jgi:hypothetical protein